MDDFENRTVRRLRGINEEEFQANYAKPPLKNTAIDIDALRQAMSTLRLHEGLLNRIYAVMRPECVTQHPCSRTIAAIERVIDNATRNPDRAGKEAYERMCAGRPLAGFVGATRVEMVDDHTVTAMETMGPCAAKSPKPEWPR